MSISSLARGTNKTRAPLSKGDHADEGNRPGFSDRWRGALARSAVVRPVARFFAGLGTCLMYHRVCDDEHANVASGSDFLPNRELIVSAGAFDQQMAFLAQNYHCLSLPDALHRLKAGRLPERSAVVTFDDGYLDNLTLALPILRKHNVPATIYVATGLIEHASVLWWYELEHLVTLQSSLSIRWRQRNMHFSMADLAEKRLAYQKLNRLFKDMSPSEQNDFMSALRGDCQIRFNYASLVLRRHQLCELAADPLITIGAHTHHHLVLSRLPDIRLRHEISRSRELLEEWLERPIKHLAYPFGGNQQACKREFVAARELGFKSAVTTRLGHLHRFHRNHPLALPRVAIGYQDCMARFEWKLSGLYCLARRPTSRIRI